MRGPEIGIRRRAPNLCRRSSHVIAKISQAIGTVKQAVLGILNVLRAAKETKRYAIVRKRGLGILVAKVASDVRKASRH